MRASSFTPTELTNFLECEHRTVLERRAHGGLVERPGQNELERELLSRRGNAHEAAVLSHYEMSGASVTRIARSDDADELTLAALERGDEVVYQGVLRHGEWVGRPDFLVKRVCGSETHWPHHYEVVDAKLAHDAKASAVLQVAAYTEHLAAIQHFVPELFHIAPGGAAAPIPLRVADYMAYYRTVRARFEAFMAVDEQVTYPEPVEHCGVCPWWKRCENQRRADDHLSLVANITRRQRDRLNEAGVATLSALGAVAEGTKLPGLETLPRLREQAALQAARRADGTVRYRLLGDADRKAKHVAPGAEPLLVGLEALPAPTPGDLFLDLEGDSFVDGGGLEYLFGLLELGEPLDDEFTSRDAPGEPRYRGFWARNAADEKRAFEAVVDRIVRGRAEFRSLHVYHFGHRESDALKKLSCKHQTREAEVDQLLREHVLVDLLPIVRHAVIAAVEGYTLKELEPLHGFARGTELRAAARAMQLYGWWLETKDLAITPQEIEGPIESYNRDDCFSTWKLRDWLEGLRPEFQRREGRAPARPAWKEASADDERTSRSAASAALAKRLREGVGKPPEPDSEGAARVLCANLLDWHWREAKSSWWEYFRARELAPDDYVLDRAALGGLEYAGEVRRIKQSIIYRYRFDDQDHGIRKGSTPIDPGTGDAAGTVVDITEGHIDIKRGLRSKALHPSALIPEEPIQTKAQEQSVLALGERIATKATDVGLNPVAWRLLRRTRPIMASGTQLVKAGEGLDQALPRLAFAMNGDVLAIQGPPGSGKTHVAAQMILALVREGKRVGVTANSHEVCKGLLAKVAELGNGSARLLHSQDPTDLEGELPTAFELSKDKSRIAERLRVGGLDVVGGTSWLWASTRFTDSVDYLVVDEAGQVSLANVLAVAQAAKNMVLVGDPAQLEQPQKGVHPPGADVSALEHLLGSDAVTIAPDRGVFIPTTHRLHPSICAFVSESFYDGRLAPVADLENQAILGTGLFQGSGLRFVPVPHRGNTNQSSEEVARVCALIAELGLTESTASIHARFVDRASAERPLTRDDVLVVAPYNAHVSALQRALPKGIRVGTVDKFQGKQAPIVIYSMATSTAADAPRGLEFLYSKNRLNVAISRARALAVVVASPALVQVACRTPRQMALANALCRFVELAMTQT